MSACAGVVEVFGGRPEIALTNPYQIEVLDWKAKSPTQTPGFD